MILCREAILDAYARGVVIEFDERLVEPDPLVFGQGVRSSA